ncbi:MAG TPA: hypothetical protein VEK08_01880 [Planctomycetota bacterium]|nr:hypothetical protein [Planctomycetota bacterium]
MTRSSGRLFAFFLAASILISSAASAWAADPALLLPLNRTAYQTNERIDLAVVRSSDKELAAGELTLTVSGDDGSKLVFTYPVKAAAVSGKDARTTEHLYLNAWLLRPGKYSLEAAVDGGVGKATIDVYNHVRKSDFKLVNWGRAKDVADQLPQGEDSIGFNLFYGHYGNDDQAGFIRAGVDFMSCCTMSGAHQMDIRSECDWSDPYVTRGGTVRVVRRAFQDRTRGNVPGVHFYDEPGLTWSKDPKSGEMTPHAVPAQAWSYEAAFGKAPLRYTDVDPKNPDHIARWEHWARWKLSFMDAAWKEAQFGVSQVRPDMISLTQSQYGYSAFTDGYYFNVARSLPITSGHGGYDDYGPGYFNPGYTMEIARARDFWKANWYLPTWYGNTTTDTFRLEQYLSFQTNIQGMLSPPDIDPFVGNQQKPAAQGVVESNHLMMKLGPIFNQIPVNKMPVALLYSVSNCIRAQTADMKANYAHSMPHGEGLPLVYLAGKVIQQPFTTVVEEDILDGTLAQDHKAVVLNAINYLDPKVVTALEQYIATGGAVLMTSDSKVEIKGAIKVPTVARMPDQEIIDQLSKEKKYKEMAPYTTSGKHIEAAIKIGAAFKAEFDKLGLKPVFETDNQAIIASRQAAGDIEYIFAVNATYDNESNGAKNAVKAASATISLADDSRPVYDAVTGGIVPQFQKAGGKLTGSFRFGAGQMRVFARPARTIGSVSAGAPVVVRELALEKSPVRLDLSASVADEKGKLLSGSVPVHIRVVDPLGATRH